MLDAFWELYSKHEFLRFYESIKSFAGVFKFIRDVRTVNLMFYFYFLVVNRSAGDNSMHIIITMLFVAKELEIV